MNSVLPQIQMIVKKKIPLLLYFGSFDLRDGIEGAAVYMRYIASPGMFSICLSLFKKVKKYV